MFNVILSRNVVTRDLSCLWYHRGSKIGTVPRRNYPTVVFSLLLSSVCEQRYRVEIMTGKRVPFIIWKIRKMLGAAILRVLATIQGRVVVFTLVPGIFLVVIGIVLDLVWMVATTANVQTFGYWCALLGLLLGQTDQKVRVSE